MLTLHEIHSAILSLSDQLENLVTEITKAGDQAAEAEADFKSAFARERLRARAEADEQRRKITVDEVEDRATAQTADARRLHLLAANDMTVLREALRARQAQLDGLRSLLSSFKAAGG